MLGIINAAAGAVGGLFGSLGKNKMIRDQLKEVAAQRKDNQDWFDRNYYEDATQRADAMRAITQTEEAYRNRNKDMQATAAVAGGTEEAMAATKAANAKELADMRSQIAASGEARKNAVEQQYMQQKQNLDELQRQLKGQKANGWDIANSMVGGVSAGINEMLGRQ